MDLELIITSFPKLLSATVVTLKLLSASLFFGLFLIYVTYYSEGSEKVVEDISSTLEKKLSEAKDNESENDLFFNVEYSGLDFNGNRYVLKSEEAYFDEKISEIVYMDKVDAVFYFKDNTILYIKAKKGIYNNKTFDMSFRDDVRAKYLESRLFAEKADFSNTKNYLTIYENVKINDLQGNLIADKVLFDITKQKVEIASFNKKKVSTNIKLK